MALLRLMVPEANKALGQISSWAIPIPDWPSPLDATLFTVGVLLFFWAGSLMDGFDAWEGDSDLRTMRGWDANWQCLWDKVIGTYVVRPAENPNRLTL